MTFETVELEYKNIEVTVKGFYIPEEKGDRDSLGTPASFEAREVIINEWDIDAYKILSGDDIDEICNIALEIILEAWKKS